MTQCELTQQRTKEIHTLQQDGRNKPNHAIHLLNGLSVGNQDVSRAMDQTEMVLTLVTFSLGTSV